MWEVGCESSNWTLFYPIEFRRYEFQSALTRARATSEVLQPSLLRSLILRTAEHKVEGSRPSLNSEQTAALRRERNLQSRGARPCGATLSAQSRGSGGSDSRSAASLNRPFVLAAACGAVRILAVRTALTFGIAAWLPFAAAVKSSRRVETVMRGSLIDEPVRVGTGENLLRNQSPALR